MKPKTIKSQTLNQGDLLYYFDKYTNKMTIVRYEFMHETLHWSLSENEFKATLLMSDFNNSKISINKINTYTNINEWKFF